MEKSFETNLATLLKARFPLLYISTWEEERVIDLINQVVSDASQIKTPRKVFLWSITEGIHCEGGFTNDDHTKTPLGILEAIKDISDPAVFILKDYHVFFGDGKNLPDVQVIRRVRDIISDLKTSANPKNIIFVSPTLILPVELKADVTVVDFDLPKFEDILNILNEMIESNKDIGKITIDLNNEEAEKLAKAALGLTLQEAENAFARAMADDGVLDIGDLEIVLEEKQQIIKKNQILEFINSDLDMNDVGGLENLKRWLEKRNKSWLNEAKRYCLPSPKGVLITGVPGCGKSLVSKAISAMWRLPLLRLDMGRIFGTFIGQSEENMRNAIRTAEALAPSILWIDEIEKGFSGTDSSGDSGTSARVFGTFLTWMQEKTAPVFVIATANNIHTLPPEMLRKGRFDEIFFVDLPTNKERTDIFKVHLSKRLINKEVVGQFEINQATLEHLAELTEGLVGAEIEHTVISALFEAFSENRSISIEDLENAIQNTIPLSVTQVEQIHAIREWANVRAVAATRQEDRAEYKKERRSYSRKNNLNEANIKDHRGGRAVDF
jgi:SpoVK/Ycf46/Vps4 family AAA+-type ATPase